MPQKEQKNGNHLQDVFINVFYWEMLTDIIHEYSYKYIPFFVSKSACVLF